MEESDRSKVKKSQSILLVVVLSVLLFFGSQLVGSILFQPLQQFVSSKNIQIALFTLINLAVLIFLLGFSKITSLKEAFGKPPALKNMLMVLPLFVAYLCFTVALALIIKQLFPSFDSNQAQDIGFAKNLSGIELLIAFVSLVIIVPVFEEIIFRGVLFRGLRKNISFVPAMIIVSVIFAVAHLQWNLALDTFALSLALCWLLEKSNSLIPSITLHALKNSVAFLILFVVK